MSLCTVKSMWTGLASCWISGRVNFPTWRRRKRLLHHTADDIHWLYIVSKLLSGSLPSSEQQDGKEYDSTGTGKS